MDREAPATLGHFGNHAYRKQSGDCYLEARFSYFEGTNAT